jgi:hypothetical protein
VISTLAAAHLPTIPGLCIGSAVNLHDSRLAGKAPSMPAACDLPRNATSPRCLCIDRKLAALAPANQTLSKSLAARPSALAERCRCATTPPTLSALGSTANKTITASPDVRATWCTASDLRANCVPGDQRALECVACLCDSDCSPDSIGAGDVRDAITCDAGLPTHTW